MVAREPFEVIPVLDFVILFRALPIREFRPAILPEVSLIPGGMGHDDGPKSPLVDQFLAGAVGFAVMALQSDDDRKVIGFRLLTRFGDKVAAGNIDRQRLFSKDMLFGIDRCFEMLRTETGRRDHEDSIDVRLNDGFISVDAEKDSLGIDVLEIWSSLVWLDWLARVVEPVLEIVG